MAGKKTGKSSKTEHVLNLLSNPASPSTPASEEDQEGEPLSQTPVEATHSDPDQEEISPPPTPPELRHRTPPILEVARNNQEAISNSIHAALEEELARDLLSQEEESPDPPSAPSAAPSDPPVTDAPPPPSESVEIPSTAPKERFPENSPFLVVNIIEMLVEEHLQHYMKRCRTCTCLRCAADIKSLTLTRLPAKYVVLQQQSLAPILGLYRSRFEGAVINQLIYSCKIVTDFPRH